MQAALGALELSSNIIQQLQYDDADYVLPVSRGASVAGDRQGSPSKYESSTRKVPTNHCMLAMCLYINIMI